MKLHFIFKAVTLLFFACLWACSAGPSPGEEGQNAGNAVSLDSLLAKLSPYEINADTAKKDISEYQVFADSVIQVLDKMPNKFPNPEEKMIYGVKVDRNELFDVLKARPEDSLYIMIGTKSSGETEFFFAFESKTLKTNVAAAGNWHFYDFTQPCPTACPNFQ